MKAAQILDRVHPLSQAQRNRRGTHLRKGFSCGNGARSQRASGQTRPIFKNLTVELFFLPYHFANAKIVCQLLGQQSVSLGGWMRIMFDA